MNAFCMHLYIYMPELFGYSSGYAMYSNIHNYVLCGGV